MKTTASHIILLATSCLVLISFLPNVRCVDYDVATFVVAEPDGNFDTTFSIPGFTTEYDETWWLAVENVNGVVTTMVDWEGQRVRGSLSNPRSWGMVKGAVKVDGFWKTWILTIWPSPAQPYNQTVGGESYPIAHPSEQPPTYMGIIGSVISIAAATVMAGLRAKLFKRKK